MTDEGKSSDITGSLHSELPANAASSSTAISFFPSLVRDTYTLLIGLESGTLMVWSLAADGKTWGKLGQVAPYFSHSLSVKRIKFNKRFSDVEKENYTVATCSSD